MKHLFSKNITKVLSAMVLTLALTVSNLAGFYPVASAVRADQLPWPSNIGINIADGGNATWDASTLTLTLLQDIELSGELSPGGDDPVTIDLNGHTLSRDPSSSGTNIINVVNCNVNIIGNGTINGGYDAASNSGGYCGLYIQGGKTVTLESGTITNCASNHGAGVNIQNGTFIMNGGSITGNKAFGMHGNANIGGGGVFIFNGSFIMNGGSITGNTFRAYPSDTSPDEDVDVYITNNIQNSFIKSCNTIGTNVQYANPGNMATITFDANGGTGTMEQHLWKNRATPLAANTFTRADYTFSGWNTFADGSGTSYAYDAQINVNNDITLYAQWTPNSVPAPPAPAPAPASPAAPAVTPAPINTAPAVTTAPELAMPVANFYVIQRGDSLYKIARSLNTTVPNLCLWNNITNPNRIKAGSVLIYYTIGNEPAAATTHAATADSTGSYTVKRGDSLYKIARLFNTTVNYLATLNGITDPNRIRVNQLLRY